MYVLREYISGNDARDNDIRCSSMNRDKLVNKLEDIVLQDRLLPGLVIGCDACDRNSGNDKSVVPSLYCLHCSAMICRDCRTNTSELKHDPFVDSNEMDTDACGRRDFVPHYATDLTYSTTSSDVESATWDIFDANKVQQSLKELVKGDRYTMRYGDEYWIEKVPSL